METILTSLMELLPYLLYVSIAVLVTTVLGRHLKLWLDTRRILKVGLPATARVLDLEMGAMVATSGVRRRLEVVMQVEVSYPNRPRYQTQLRALVPELQIPQVQPGATLDVRVDPANPLKIALVTDGGESPGSQSMPLRKKLLLAFFYSAVILGAGVPVAIIFVNTTGWGLSSQPDKTTVCGRVMACCQANARNATDLKTCRNFGMIGVEEQFCQTFEDSYRRTICPDI